MNDNTKGYVRCAEEETDYYITTYDEFGNKCVVIWNEDHWELDSLIGNKSAREDDIVFEGTFAECSDYIADQFED